MRWKARHQRALELAYSGRLTERQIADQVGVSRRALCYWKASPEWRARYQALVDQSWLETRRAQWADLPTELWPADLQPLYI